MENNNNDGVVGRKKNPKKLIHKKTIEWLIQQQEELLRINQFFYPSGFTEIKKNKSIEITKHHHDDGKFPVSIIFIFIIIIITVEPSICFKFFFVEKKK